MKPNYCGDCGKILMYDESVGVFIHEDSGLTNCAKPKATYRNYNIGRPVDEKTMRFEQELEALQAKYDFYMETETF